MKKLLKTKVESEGIKRDPMLTRLRYAPLDLGIAWIQIEKRVVK